MDISLALHFILQFVDAFPASSSADLAPQSREEG